MQIDRTFRIHASQAGKIMKSDRSGKAMGDTARTFCKDWVKEQLYDRYRQFSSKYTEKGNLMEQEAIDYAARVLGWGDMVMKNETTYTDADLIGTPDVVLADYVPDIKCSWSCWSFPIFDAEVSDDYYWQIQSYLALTGRSRGAVVYCLMDAPDYLIEREAYGIARSQGESEVDMELFDRVKADMTYSHLPDSLRLKVFEIQRNDAHIAALRSRVLECREYISTLAI